MNLGMAVMASRNAIIGSGCHDLVKFHLSILAARFSVARLQKSAAPPAAIVVAPVGSHLNNIFLAHNGLDHIAQIIRHRLAKALADDLTRILNRKFNLQILVPVGTDLQFSLPDPFGIVLVDARNFQIRFNLEFS
jgi:hypothetical protein